MQIKMRHRRVALAIADGRKTQKEIAKEFKMHESTLRAWRETPEFAFLIADYEQRLERDMMDLAVAKKRNRIERLNRSWLDLQEVIEQRKRHARDLVYDKQDAAVQAGEMAHTGRRKKRVAEGAQFGEYPGDLTGLIVKDYRGRDADRPVFKVDTETLTELRALEQQAARELGQWIDLSKIDLNSLSNERLLVLLGEVSQHQDI